jgi:hypothetical protein
MTTILVGECEKSNLFQIWDADAALETEFEFIVAKALICIYVRHWLGNVWGEYDRVKLIDLVASRPESGARQAAG